MNPREEIAHLTEVLERANHQYYVLDAPEMEDYEYDRLLRRLEELKASGVNVIVLLAISDSGKPCYDSMMAEKVSALEIPCFACPPERLPELLEAAMKHQSLQNFSR